MSIDETQPAQSNFTLPDHKLNAVINHLVDGVVLTDEKGSVILWNPKLEEITGINAAEVLGQPFWEVQFRMTPPKEQTHEYKAHIQRVIENLLQTGKSPWLGQKMTRENLHTDGILYYVQGTVFSIKTERGFMLGGISRDITERVKAREALKKSEEQFSLLMLQTPYVVEIYDMDGLQTSVNEAYEKLWGFPAKTTVNKFNVLKSKEVEDSGLIVYIQRAYSGESLTVPEYEFDPSGPTEAQGVGRVRWLNTRIFPLKTASGEIRNIVITHEDITDRKWGEQVLLESENRFQYAMDATKDGLYDWDLVTNEIYYSPGWKSMLGYEYDALPNDFSIWEKLTEPKDVKRSWEMQQELINKQRERFELEFKMKHKDGHWIDILSRASAVFDDNGKAIRIVGTHVDITERKRAEENQRLTETRLSVVFNNTTDLQLLVAVEQGGELRVIAANRAYIETGNNFGLQLSEEDLVGKTLKEILNMMGISKEVCESTYRNYLTAVKTGEAVKYTESIPLELGVYHSEITLTPILDQDGIGLYVLYNSHNVSELRETTNALEKMNAELEDRVKERTEKLQIVVDATIDREVRMAGLKKVIKKLRVQLQDAGLEPVADDPLLGDQGN